MVAKLGFNDYTVNGDVVCIQIKDRVCIIDLADLEMVRSYRWCLTGGYAVTYLFDAGKRSALLMHRHLIDSPHSEVDHADQDKLNNRRSNLRLATDSQNMANVGISKRNTSGFKGVSWNKRKQKWGASICSKRKQFYLGHFDTPEEASEAYKAKALELFGEFACTG